MRIVHFSDVHIGCLPRGCSFLFDKRFLGALNFFFRRRLKLKPYLLRRAVTAIQTLAPECVICTGDITCVGSPQEFDAAVAALRPLAHGAPWTFVYVPGNHDCYVGEPACRQAMESAFATLNAGRWQLDDLPCEMRIGDIALYVVNEAMPTNWLLSSGTLAPSAERQLLEWLGRPRVEAEKRIVVGHFPLLDSNGEPYSWRRRFVYPKALHRALEAAQCDGFLCGHEHTPFIRIEDSGCMEICAGALTIHGRLSVLDYVPSSGRFSHFWVDLEADEPNLSPLPLAEPA